jgi:hypothetical protein
MLTQTGNIGGRNHMTVCIDHAKGSAGDLPQLQNYTLKYTVGHLIALLLSLVECVMYKIALSL